MSDKILKDYSSELELLTVRTCINIVKKSYDLDGAILNLLDLEVKLSVALNEYYNPLKEVDK